MDLHYFMADRGSVLATRSRGRDAAEHLIDLAQYVGENERVVIDFKGVEAVSSPFLQEVLVELAYLFGHRPLFVNMNEDVAATISFTRERMAERARAVGP